MTDKRREIRKAKRTPGESTQNARERARVAAAQAAKRKKERRILIGAAAGLLVLVLIAGLSIQLWRSNKAPEATGTGGDVGFGAEAVDNGQPVKLGKPGATVTLTMYTDFLCPHCQDFEQQFGSTITSNQDAGVLTVESVPMSFIAAESSTLTNAYGCAIQQNAGQAYSSALFANTDVQWTDQKLVDLGKQVKPDMPAEFETCVTRKKNQSWVDSMNTYAQDKGVTSTPTLFLNGEKLEVSGLTPQTLDQKIKEAAQG